MSESDRVGGALSLLVHSRRLMLDLRDARNQGRKQWYATTSATRYPVG
jgi:hypothetical protein